MSRIDIALSPKGEFVMKILDRIPEELAKKFVQEGEPSEWALRYVGWLETQNADLEKMLGEAVPYLEQVPVSAANVRRSVQVRKASDLIDLLLRIRAALSHSRPEKVEVASE